jgi:FlaA1/EpsC-like NDP-sugar epimerase
MITIPEFYNNRDVFITGATGFVGKVLIEKLLRSCPGIKRIFLLLRAKRSKSINVRLEEIKNTPVKRDQLLGQRSFSSAICISSHCVPLFFTFSKQKF